MEDRGCKEEYIRRIHKVQDYMEQNIGKSLTIEELSNVAGFSKYHFSRIFQGIMKEPLAHYVNRVRMEYSLFMLAHRLDKNMTDIAYELGFSDSAVFSRAFKNYYNVSPREYRKEYSKNCKEPFLLSEYNKDTAKKEWSGDLFPVTGQITFTKLEEKQVAYVRHIGTYDSLAKEYVKLMEKLFDYATKQNLLVEGQSWILAMYHDNPEFGEETSFRTSLGITVPDHHKVLEDGIFGVMTLEPGLYAIGHFIITPEQYPDAWNFMYQEWLTGSGYVPRNSYPFEVYLNNPQENEDHLSEVDIYVPIEPIRYSFAEI